MVWIGQQEFESEYTIKLVDQSTLVGTVGTLDGPWPQLMCCVFQLSRSRFTRMRFRHQPTSGHVGRVKREEAKRFAEEARTESEAELVRDRQTGLVEAE